MTAERKGKIEIKNLRAKECTYSGLRGSQWKEGWKKPQKQNGRLEKSPINTICRSSNIFQGLRKFGFWGVHF